MHLSILQVYYEPLDITGPALSSTAASQQAIVNNDVWSTAQKYFLSIEVDQNAVWGCFGGRWEGVAHHLEHEVHDGINTSKVYYLWGVWCKHGRIYIFFFQRSDDPMIAEFSQGTNLDSQIGL